MSKRQTQKMLRLMASGEPVELTSPMASVKKLARLAFVAQQFGYEYADVRQSNGRNGALTMLILPDPSPHARGRAAQNWAQYPNAADGVSLPPLVPDAFELLKARINFDLTGKSAEKRMGYAALGLTIGCVILALRSGGDASAFIVAGVIWLLLMAVFGIGLLVTRKRNAKFAARLQAAGFMPVTDENGRMRYLPPGAQLPGHGNPFGGGPYGGAPGQGGGVPGQAPVGYGYQQPAQGQGQAPGPYAQPAPGPYAQPAPGPYPPQPAPGHAPGPYGTQPPAAPYPPQQQPGPYAPQQPPQNPHWQHPQR
ncbi:MULTISPECIES: hypothetical protein [Streptomyces]|uniref:Integral membrane protein n=1 Tax=Streptomyces koelreuteriae TaxID=2838015 RepID=A0ABX8FW71_9ACTN|nr:MULTISPECIES: hypothetical protein [Streptomyces]QWB25245.1 hypothetical protein KJK29_23225 [Streptomyces koelreuteriae]UUA08283.1 hypothetical protein NNW98_23370 [Streptomyces koelreuteriae]UUA15889.1 hypothetical protein NNW99_23255 [Streptomyces sp. CRCS-T-1]